MRPPPHGELLPAVLTEKVLATILQSQRGSTRKGKYFSSLLLAAVLCQVYNRPQAPKEKAV